MTRWRKSFFISIVFVALLAAAPLRALASPATGYWWNPNSPGSGFLLEIQGSTMYMSGFLYAANGNATWLASSGPMTSGNQYSGALVTYAGGQTLSGSYQHASLSPGSGTISINFVSDTVASLSWANAGASATFQIQRFDIVTGGSATPQPAVNPQSGWWWNSAESGRGFAIEVQGGQMYFAGYMYDSNGAPTWYLAIGPMADAALFQGQLQQFGNGPTLGGAYKAPSVVNTNAGAVTLQFAGTNSATLTLPNGAQIPLARFAFGLTGPTLAAFSPPSASPAGVLKLSGSNFDPTAKFSLTFSDNTGYSVNVPLTSVTSTSATASVPPYFNPATAAFGSGSVNLRLTQTSGASSVDSNTLAGFGIQPVPTAKNAGQSTLSLIRATLAEAEALQGAVIGTTLHAQGVDAAFQAEVTDLQNLLANVQSVVQNGLSFSLGTVGGVNITVTQSNIADVDSLILASLQSLASPPAGGAASSAEKTAEAGTAGCMSAEASAFAQAMVSGNGNLDALAKSLIEAPGTSPACNTVGAFTSAYQIFGGAGGSGLGLTNGGGTPAVPAARLPGAALFATANNHTNITLGLNALLSPTFGNQTPALQFAIGGVTGLQLPIENELIAKSTGAIAGNLSHTQALVTLVAPPVLAPGSVVPTNLPNGFYNYSYSFSLTVFGRPQQGSGGPIPLTNTDGTAFAAVVQGNITAFDNARNCNGGGFTCSATVTPFDGTTFQVVVTVSGPNTTGTITYLLTKT